MRLRNYTAPVVSCIGVQPGRASEHARTAAPVTGATAQCEFGRLRGGEEFFQKKTIGRADGCIRPVARNIALSRLSAPRCAAAPARRRFSGERACCALTRRLGYHQTRARARACRSKNKDSSFRPSASNRERRSSFPIAQVAEREGPRTRSRIRGTFPLNFAPSLLYISLLSHRRRERIYYISVSCVSVYKTFSLQSPTAASPRGLANAEKNRAGPPNDNDPSAGSPTETLLRLLLPLNDQVWSSSRQHRQCRGTAAHQSEDLTKSFNR